VPDPSVQPPEGLRKIAKSAVEEFVQIWNGEFGDVTETIADAVLAALFDACEVRERWGTRWTYADGEQRTAWWSSRAEAETERDWPTPASTVELLRRCDLQTPPEPEINT
jgi:hypothetical protein